MTAASVARQTRQLTRGFAARMSGKTERGPDRRVRRGSYDVDDRRAQVFRPIGDGTTAGALSWIDCLLKTVSEWDDTERRKHGGRPLGLHGLRVLETLLGRRGAIPIDFKTGRLEPALETIARVARVSKTTVVRALARLKAMKVLRWVRRSQKTDNAGQLGPQREQVSNAYWFDLSELPARVLRRFRDLQARRRLAREKGATDAAAPPPTGPSDPELRSILAALEVAVERNASPPNGEYPCSGVEG